MARTYKRKHARNPAKRMAAVARLRADGLSLRQIAAAVAVSHDTVWRDLAKWDAAHANVSEMPVRNTPPGGENLTAKSDSESNIISLNDRRKQA